VFQHPVLSKQLIFRGGTALHKLFFHPPRRYSEDIDLVQIKAVPIGPVFDALNEMLEPLLGKPQRKQGPGVMTLTYRMNSEIPPVTPMKMKVEINSREHFSVLGINRKAFSVESPWFSGACEISTLKLEELLATKLHALCQRRKGRDLFDLWLGLTVGNADAGQVVNVFRHYMEAARHHVSQKNFAANLAQKRRHAGFMADISALLPVDTDFNFEDGFKVVEQKIIPLL
jgi:predicted nucleotidyltransferase component of viral defense system